jgi:hypothetical protein
MLEKLHKLDSLRAIVSVGLPLLPFEVLTQENFEEQMQDFLRKHGVPHFMVRTDGKGKFSPSMNDAELNEATEDAIQKFFDEDYTVFIMTPGNIYRNFHSLNIMKTDGMVHVEIVGPGFIATDLNRYGFLHERFESRADILELRQKSIIAAVAYNLDRAKKIATLGSEECRAHNSYLIVHEQYVPCSHEELQYIISAFPNLQKAADALGNQYSCNFVASMSFVDLGEGAPEPIFWDLYVI